MQYRKLLVILGIGCVFFVVAPPVMAVPPQTQAVTTAATAPSTSGASFVSLTKFPAFAGNATASGLGGFINSLYTYLIGIAAILAVLEIIWGGFLWMGSGASVTSKESGRKKIMMALVGLLLVLSPVIVFSIINPSILSLNLSTGNIHINQPTPTASTANMAAPAAGCTLVHTGTYLETYLCADENAASNQSCQSSSLLTKKTVACAGKNADGSCRTVLYCSGKKIVVRAYSILYAPDGFSTSVGPNTVFSEDSAAVNTFSSSCQSDGGVVKAVPQGLSGSVNLSGCTGYPEVVVPSTAKGAYCFHMTIACNPPPTRN